MNVLVRGLRASPAALFILALQIIVFFAFAQGDEDEILYHLNLDRTGCPPLCGDQSGLGRFKDLSEVAHCGGTIIFDFNIDAEPSKFSLLTPIQACRHEGSQKLEARKLIPPTTFANSSANTNGTGTRHARSDAAFTWSASESPLGDIAVAVAALTTGVLQDQEGVESIKLAKTGETVVGLYAGSCVQKQCAGKLLRDFAEKAEQQAAKQIAAQVCTKDEPVLEAFGVVAGTQDDLIFIRNALKAWHDAKCIDSLGSEELWKGVTIDTVEELPPEVHDEALVKRDTCTYKEVAAGDGCWSLADRCQTTPKKLAEYNPEPGFCNKLVPGQLYCCTSGSLPDLSPKQQADGSCTAHTIQAGDTCYALASKHSLAVDDLEKRNKNTWGWTGCQNLIVGNVMCLSKGSSPMPAPISNAICGPQVPGTAKPADMTKLASLNACPLNACCNIWGQCGLTKDFCVPSPADSGAPGAAKPGSNGCIFNCGMDIVRGSSRQANPMKIGYFEAWNKDRPCLHMTPRQINTERYTHIHYAFGHINNDFQVDMSKNQDMFDEFKTLKGVKRIVSFGGWAFSTEPATYRVFRDGVTPANRQAFANNVVKFVVDNDLDGVDFDWEYPGEPDIPGIPAGDKREGLNYLRFLTVVREALPKDKTIGIAAPASYWYLRAFPIKAMSKVLSYIVYMTYDIHGQWDYGNRWSTEGCPAGDCLRHHTNRTEVRNALAMVTKAGVPASKIVVGMPMYGRSFQMTKAGCWGPQCTYIGPKSGATPGRCTGTRGYISNFEIREIIANGGNVEQHSTREGEIVVYNGDQWVSWMPGERYDQHAQLYAGMGFAGTSDWAIDLDADFGASDGPRQGDTGSGPVFVSPDVYKKPDVPIQCEPPCTFVLPPWVLPTQTTISIAPTTITYNENWVEATEVSGAIITETRAIITSTVISIPPVTTTAIPLWNVVWDGFGGTDGGSGRGGGNRGGNTGGAGGGTGDSGAGSGDGSDETGNSDSGSGSHDTTSTTSQGNGTFIWLTSSISIPPITITQTNTRSGVTDPPITWTFSPGPYPPVRTRGPEPPDHPNRPKFADDPDDPVPPGPPPPGFPRSLGVRGASPAKPTCGPGQNCGPLCKFLCDPIDTGCKGICGCIGPLCEIPNCIGPGCFAGGGAAGGKGEEKSCRRSTTASFCKSECSVLQLPSTTKTTCKKEKCSRTVTACDTTGSTTTTTTTLKCPWRAVQTPDLDALAPSIGDGGLGGTYTPGDFTFKSMDDAPTSTTKPATSTRQVRPWPAHPTAQLFITYEISIIEHGNWHKAAWWVFYTPPIGYLEKPRDFDYRLCVSSSRLSWLDAPFLEPHSKRREKLPFPTGKISLTVKGTAGCIYEGWADGTGELTCPDLLVPVSCKPYVDMYGDGEPGYCSGIYLLYPRVLCKW